jgi:hypothetical protein
MCISQKFSLRELPFSMLRIIRRKNHYWVLWRYCKLMDYDLLKYIQKKNQLQFFNNRYKL